MELNDHVIVPSEKQLVLQDLNLVSNEVSPN